MDVKLVGCALFAAALVSGCGSLTAVDAEGQPESALVWPQVDQVMMDQQRGTYGNLQQIKMVREGSTRDDVYQAIGRPHFNEGFGVREWDYLFYFDQPQGGELVCQYKLLFDQQKRVRNIYWQTVSPAQGICPPAG